MSGPPETEAELENFRRRWREEVSARSNRPTRDDQREPASTQKYAVQTEKPFQGSKGGPTSHADSARETYDSSFGRTYHDLPDREENLKLGAAEKGLSRNDAASKEPRTALEHYEQAVDSETAGKLGDSLRLYRRAFKLDDNVHEKYKNKHFPPGSTKAKAAQHAPTAPHTQPTTKVSDEGASLYGLPSGISQLIQDFAALSIPAIEPPTDASPQPPCPISMLPQEITSQILLALAESNVAIFSRLALVCKRFAYLTMTEEQIWRAVTLSESQGFGNMHYKFQCDIAGKLVPDEEEEVLGEDFTLSDPESSPITSSLALTTHLLATYYSNSWRQMYRMRPRLRFHGVYISTVNYTRAGAASASVSTWATPVHVVTYYRYLRFFRDGTCISLLTTAEPLDVVHIITKENMPDKTMDAAQARRAHHLERAQASRPPQTSLEKSGSSHAQAGKTEQIHALPSSQIMKDALRGRWRLSGPGDGSDPAVSTEAEGDLHIETEGVVPRYTYKMLLGVGALGAGNSGGHPVGATKRGSRNNRLIWKGYWSHNILTDDWAEFGLRNDKPYVFSRVKSYGIGT